MDATTALKVDIGVVQLNKHGEELCGDYVETIDEPTTIVVMSDGLGSGVKAHILSALTGRMAGVMLKGGLELGEVIESLTSTLPVCEVRRLAYSTFSILRITSNNDAYLAEYDNPPVILGHGSRVIDLERTARDYGGRTVRETYFKVRDGDWIVMISDGVLHAGIGGIWNLGWGLERISEYLCKVAPRASDAGSLALELSETVSKLYAGKPGDDATVVAVKVRRPRYLTILAGPPVQRSDDSQVTARFMDMPGKKAICGGTTSIMVARELGRPLEVNLSTLKQSVPPTGRIEGIDLVTEGILTLTRVADELSKGFPVRRELLGKSDGPSRLVDLLLEADHICFLVGRAMNPAHQSPDLPVSLALKPKVIQELARLLETNGKTVEVHVF